MEEDETLEEQRHLLHVIGEAMKIKADNYTIGDLAKFYGCPRIPSGCTTKKGVLLSQKNDENNYRIYSRDDMIMMDYIVKLRMLEIPPD